jgi:hypothetical protein
MEQDFNLEKLADDVASVLAQREDSANNAKVLIGEVVILVGATYVVTKLVQRVKYRRYYKHKFRKV